MNWTEENTAELLRLYDAGKSMSEIGRALGCNRNQVSGKLWRVMRRKRKPGTNRGRPITREETVTEPDKRNAWDYRTFAPYPIWKAERQKERERGLR